MFYNHASVAQDRYFVGRTPAVSGINLAFGHDVAQELEAKLTAANNTPRATLHHKRLDHLQPFFFDLGVILCPSGDWEGASVPTPDVVESALLATWNRLPRRTIPPSAADEVMRRLTRPEGTEYDHDGSSRMPDGPAFRLDRRLDRPKVTFISGRTDDRRTPRITLEPIEG
jgi:hypothetical protein